MKQNNLTYSKVLLIILIVAVPFSVSNFTDDTTAVELSEDSLKYYQTTPCKISYAEFLLKGYSEEIFSIRLANSEDIQCFGKVNYVEPTSDGYVLFISSHSLPLLLMQSIIWLLVITFIPSNKKFRKVNWIGALFCSILFTFHFVNEENYYASSNKYFSNILNLENYLLIGVFLTFFFIFILSEEVFENRRDSLINYFPFLFLLVGTFMAFNINFYIMILCFFGFKYLLKTKFTTFDFIYFLFATYWIINVNTSASIFDVDKLKGFISPSNSTEAIIFWSIVLYLTIKGILYFLKYSDSLKYLILKNNFLRSGALIFIFGTIASTNLNLNLLFHYLLGLNKSPIKQFESIAGNTWRGLSASAEAIGEFYAILFIFIFLGFFYKKININYTDFFLLAICLISFYRANNVAAFLSAVVIIVYIIAKKTIKNKSVFYTFISTTAVLSGIVFYYQLKTDSYFKMGNQLIYNAFKYATTNFNLESTIQLLDNRNFDALKALYGNDFFSSSLVSMSNVLTNPGNIDNLPNIVTLLSIFSLLINRSEKWGYFISSYDPTYQDFLLGTGPMNFNNYYDSQVFLNSSELILPHSSLLIFIMFFGLFFSICLCIYLIYKIYNKQGSELPLYYLIIFFSINFIKSDSILYVSTFITFIILFFLSTTESENYG